MCIGPELETVLSGPCLKGAVCPVITRHGLPQMIGAVGGCRSLGLLRRVARACEILVTHPDTSLLPMIALTVEKPTF